MEMFGFTQEQAQEILRAARHGVDGPITAGEVADRIEDATSGKIERGEAA